MDIVRCIYYNQFTCVHRVWKIYFSREQSQVQSKLMLTVIQEYVIYVPFLLVQTLWVTWDEMFESNFSEKVSERSLKNYHR